jgi:hypothetical protein
VSALASHPEAPELLRPLLEAPFPAVRAAAVSALASHPEAPELLRPLLEDPERSVRAAAVSALASHPEAPELLRPLLEDPEWSVRAAAVSALASHPEAPELLRPLLEDPFPDVRAAVVAVLRSLRAPAAPGATALRQLDALEQTLVSTFGEASSWEHVLSRESLPSFLQSPRPLHFEDERALGQQALSWVLRCMTQPAAAAVPEPRPSFGHLYLEDLGPRGRALWVHVQMEPYELARQREVVVSTNVLRAYEHARFLTTTTPTWVVLACVDVDAEDVRPLIPAIVERMATSKIANLRQPPLYLRSPFYGFALGHGAAPPELPAPAALFAADLRRRWPALPKADQRALISFLVRQAQSATVEPWMLVAPLGALAEYLPPKLAAVLRARLPTGVARAAELLELARAGADPSAPQLPEGPPILGTAASAISVRVQRLADTLIADEASTRPAAGWVADQLDEVAPQLPALEAGDVLRLLTALDTFWAQALGEARTLLARRLLAALGDLPFTDPKVLRRRSGLLSQLRRYLHEQG